MRKNQPSITWTGGQYSLFRIVLGLVAIGCCVGLATGLALEAGGTALWLWQWVQPVFRAAPPWALATSAMLAAGLSGLVVLGWQDRFAAFLLAVFFAGVEGTHPAALGGGAGALALVFLLHALVPGAPYLSYNARSRTDPAGAWRFPTWLWWAGWFALALVWADRLLTEIVLGGALEHLSGAAYFLGLMALALGAAVQIVGLAFIPTCRYGARGWLLFLAIELVLLPVLGNPGMYLLIAFIFRPSWVAPRPGPRRTIVFFDGECGLCHRAIRFLLAEDRSRDLRFAPLQGETFARWVPERRRAALPNSVIVRPRPGRFLTHSTAALYLGERCGGLWRVLAILGGLVPRPLRDGAYNGIAAIRHRLFPSPKSSCPLMPKELRARMLP